MGSIEPPEPSVQITNNQIRPLIPSDLEKICRFCGRTGVFSLEEINCLRQDLQSFLDGHEPLEDKVWVFGGVDPQGVIYYGPLSISDRGYLLYWIATDPLSQRQGIGRQLIQHMERRLRGKNARLVMIETSSRDDYTRPRDLYVRTGYKQVAVVPEYYAEGDHKCIFLKIL